MFKVRSLIVLFSMLFFAHANAMVTMNALYEAELSVPAQSHDVRERAVKEAFKEVMTKLTGNPAILEQDVIKENLRRANYFVKEYHYSTTSPDAYNYSLHVSFQKDEIDQLVKQANIPFWDSKRPVILVWLIVNRHTGTEILSSEMQSPFIRAMLKQSKKLGLPIVLPMMDVPDLTTISSEDIEEMNQEKLFQAAKRYGADGILIGNIERTRFNYQSRWQLVLGGKDWGWKIDKNNEYELGADIINKIGQALTKQLYDEQALTLIIDQVNRPGDLINVMKYLRQLPDVKESQVSKVTNDTVELQVTVKTQEAFRMAIDSGRRLSFKSEDPETNRYYYELRHES